jgi:hypothetical protein
MPPQNAPHIAGIAERLKAASCLTPGQMSTEAENKHGCSEAVLKVEATSTEVA